MSRRGRDLFRRVAPVLDAAGAVASRLPGPVRRGLWSVSRPLTGHAGLGVRYALVRANGAQVGENVSIHSQAVVLHPQGLRTGRNVSVHPLCYIDATGGITIGDDVSIAHMVTIMSTSHHFHRTDIPINDQGVDLLPTTIGDDVWIGAQAVVVGGVRVGSHSVIGANAVVTKDVPEWSVVAGVPARVIGSRRP